MDITQDQPTASSFRAEPMTLPDLPRRPDAILIVPPFAALDFPHLGVHLLQGCAKAAGFEVAVIYAGMLLAREITQPVYHALSDAVTLHWSGGRVFSNMLGERVFARAAYGVPLLGRQAEAKLASIRLEAGFGRKRCVIDFPRLVELSAHVEDWVERFAQAVAELGCPVVGCTTVFEQTASSIAILRRIKQRAPGTTTLIGGANCTGGMAEGIASLSDAIDFAFSGECEKAFPAFLAGARPEGRVVEGEVCMDLDALPTPDYDEYYRQRRACFEDDALARQMVALSYESSRGCWWGQKHHCTFCGVASMRYREKAPDRVIGELRELLAKHPSRRVHNVDDIMPHSYFKSVLPRLPEELPGVRMFYEEKANLTLEKVVLLRKAGVDIAQPGIEALSSPLLRRMDKGTLARHNVALLRYARASYLSLIWGLLFGFPGDRAEDYEHYLTLLPLLHHLEPPKIFMPLCLFRFSPYWKYPERYGIQNLRPAEVYGDILPEGADARLVAYYFDGDFSSVAGEHPELIAAIDREVRAWNARWLPGRGKLPILSVSRTAPDTYHLTDTRDLPGAVAEQPLTRRQAAAVLVGRPRENSGLLTDEMVWARAGSYAVELDGWHVPLATAHPDLIAEFEQAYGPGAELQVAMENETTADTLVRVEALRRPRADSSIEPAKPGRVVP
ncbi:RiPP maturation radical SAM C-methyltransferase [Polyangium sp. 6x1]|uniref:RiPP maturation radical SAM C-methyltransferase n=1 Tax=Polyangium sp. 6x1 TaxID=3042689 RepID=UPI002482E04C|nr:RiPP maturation radical SAM C-methyltransferase [Polyangium sp. 6x1]MDI1449279.1 RiPP maturation radical SAM C-methyltransferase [Polyangium sp. 6x1]